MKKVAVQELIDTIRSRCVSDGGCLLWQGAMADGTCPQIRRGGKTVNVRRAYYEATVGPIPAGMVVAVTCECKRCIRHTEPMTVGEVTRRLAAKGVFSGLAQSAKIATGKRKHSRVPQEVVRQIRQSDEPGRVIAQRFNLDESYVPAVRHGRKRREYGSWCSGLGLSQ